MYVCMYVCIYIYIYTHVIYIYIYRERDAYINRCLYLFMNIMPRGSRLSAQDDGPPHLAGARPRRCTDKVRWINIS